MEKELFKTSITIQSGAGEELELNMTEAEGRDLPSVAAEAESADGGCVTVYCCSCCCC